MKVDAPGLTEGLSESFAGGRSVPPHEALDRTTAPELFDLHVPAPALAAPEFEFRNRYPVWESRRELARIFTALYSASPGGGEPGTLRAYLSAALTT